MESSADIERLRAALAAERARADEVAAELALAHARNADAATIACQSLEIAKLKRQIWPRSERTARLLDQMELELEELEAAATEDEIAAEQVAARTTTVSAFTRKRPSRQPFPAHSARERVVVPAPTTCDCCGGEPPLRRVEAHAFTAERSHGDDMTVPVPAKGKPTPADAGCSLAPIAGASVPRPCAA